MGCDTAPVQQGAAAHLLTSRRACVWSRKTTSEHKDGSEEGCLDQGGRQHTCLCLARLHGDHRFDLQHAHPGRVLFRSKGTQNTAGGTHLGADQGAGLDHLGSPGTS